MRVVRSIVAVLVHKSLRLTQSAKHQRPSSADAALGLRLRNQHECLMHLLGSLRSLQER